MLYIKTHILFSAIFILFALTGSHHAAAGDAEPAGAGTSYRPDRLRLLDAVRRSLVLQPSLFIQKEQINVTSGALQSAGGAFDLLLQIAPGLQSDYGVPPYLSQTFNKLDSATIALNLVKQFRSGLHVTTGITAAKYTIQGIDQETLTPQINFVLPLLRGAGAADVAAGEISARFALEADQYTLIHLVSQAVHDTSLAYWEYVAALERRTVLGNSEERARMVVKEIEALIEAEELPAAELVTIQANLANKTSARIAADQAVIAARHALGIAMGVSAAEIFTLPPPDDQLPRLAPQLSDPGSVTQAYLRLATALRKDLHAAHKRVEAADAQVNAMRHRLNPQLDLNATARHNGIISGDYVPGSGGRADLASWSIGATFSYPLNNDLARGNLQQSFARYRQNVIQAEELARAIQGRVQLVVNDINNIEGRLRKADESVRAYEVAVKNQQEKFRMGEATLIELFDTEDRLDSVLLNQIAARQTLAGQIVRLRFETGTLFRTDGEHHAVELAELITLPGT